MFPFAWTYGYFYREIRSGDMQLAELLSLPEGPGSDSIAILKAACCARLPSNTDAGVRLRQGVLRVAGGGVAISGTGIGLWIMVPSLYG